MPSGPRSWRQWWAIQSTTARRAYRRGVVVVASMDAGAYDTSDLQLNGGGVDADLWLTSAQVPASAGLLGLTWGEP